MFSGNNFSTNESAKSVIATVIIWFIEGIFNDIAFPLKNFYVLN